MQDRIKELEKTVKGLNTWVTNFSLNYPPSPDIKQALRDIKDLEEGIENASKTFGNFQVRHNIEHDKLSKTLEYQRKEIDKLKSKDLAPQKPQRSFLDRILNR